MQAARESRALQGQLVQVDDGRTPWEKLRAAEGRQVSACYGRCLSGPAKPAIARARGCPSRIFYREKGTNSAFWHCLADRIDIECLFIVDLLLGFASISVFFTLPFATQSETRVTWRCLKHSRKNLEFLALNKLAADQMLFVAVFGTKSL